MQCLQKSAQIPRVLASPLCGLPDRVVKVLEKYVRAGRSTGRDVVLMFVTPLQECVVCGNIYIDHDEATAALTSPSSAQTSNIGQAAAAQEVEKGKSRVDSSSQVRKLIGCLTMAH
jgi:hypothetical protein